MLIEQFPPFFQNTIILHHSLAQWILVFITTLGCFITLKAVKFWGSSILNRLAKATRTHIDDLLAKHASNIGDWLLWSLSIPIGSQWIQMADGPEAILLKLPLMALIIQLFIWTKPSIDFLLQHYIDSRPTDVDRVNIQTMLGPIRFTSLLISWSLLVLLALQNIGINVTALVTGLGIGGVAIALAVQNILGDLFAAFSIVADKPFIVGDFLVIDDFAGNVTHIGLKTTRIKSLGGEELIFANNDLLNSRIKNYRPLKERRIVFTVGVLYNTSAKQLESIPATIQHIIESHDNLRFDRSHVARFNDSSIDIETVYFVLDPEYNAYMDAQQSINLQIFNAFNEQSIGFAFPTQTVYLTQETPLQTQHLTSTP